MSKIAFVQLCRFGDVVSLLPIAYHLHQEGHEVTFFTHESFSSILDTVSYVKQRKVTTTHRDLEGSVAAAQKEGYDQVICAQVYSGPIDPLKYENYQLQQWYKAGHLNQFHDYPLIFDKRDAAGEALAKKMHIPPEDGRPLLAFNLHSVSSPFALPQSQNNDIFRTAKWIKEAFSEKYRIVDLGNVCVRHIGHLIGLIDAADFLISVDTLHLHLAYGTKTPTIALVYEELWKQSEPRSHWLEKLTYQEALTEQGHRKIEWLLFNRRLRFGRLCRNISKLIPNVVEVPNTQPKPRTVFPISPLLGDKRSNITKLSLPHPAAFNPSIVPYKGGYLMAYRYGNGHQVAVCRTDKQFNVVEGSVTPIVLDYPTDPRLFWHPDGRQLLCIYSSGTGKGEYIRCCRVLDLRANEQIQVSYDQRLSPQNMVGRQKNWNPLIIGQHMYVIVRPYPHEVWKLKWDNGATAEPVDSIGWTNQWPIRGDLRGNTCPVKIKGDKFLSTFHTVEWSGGRAYYDTGFYIFESKPPFKVLGASTKPLLRGEDAIQPHLRTTHINCCFPTGMVVDGKDILISYGDNDSSASIIRIGIDPVLKEIGFELPRPTES